MRPLLVVAFLVPALVACRPPDSGGGVSTPQPDGTSSQDQAKPGPPPDRRYVLTEVVASAELTVYPFGTVVKSRIWANKNIRVCWENPEDIDSDFRTLSEDSVSDTWDQHSALSFTGWQKCTDGEVAVRIRIKDELPHVKTIGRYLNGKPGGVILNFDFQKWRPECNTSGDEQMKCARAMVVHEFGHVIGFAHEHIRSDTPPECEAEKKGTRGTWNVTEFDEESVMNYCSKRWLGDGSLSPLDIKAVGAVYGT